MPFDINTAVLVKRGRFDISTARPIARPAPEAPRDRFLPGEAKVENLILERTDPVETLRREVETPFKFGTPIEIGKSILKPAVTTSKIASIPITRLSAAVGGLGLGLQKAKGLKESLTMAKEGVLGRKQFRSFDPARVAGVPGPIATGLELFTEILIPLKVLGGINKIFRGPIQKFSDKKLLETGRKLIKSSDDAVNLIGKRLDKVYRPINKVKVDATKVIDDVTELPDAIIKHIERNVGNVDDILDNFDIEKARELKRIIGRLRPTAFGKTARGAADTVIDEQINRAYGTIKQAMQGSLNKVKLGKEAKKLLQADDAFSRTMNASRVVKKAIIDPTLKLPTKAGRAAAGLVKEGDVTFRQALNRLKASSFSISRDINKSVEALQSFNRLQKIQKFSGIVGRAAVFGIVTGGTAGRILGKQQ